MYLHFSISYISDGKYKFRTFIYYPSIRFSFSQEKLVVSTISIQKCVNQSMVSTDIKIWINLLKANASTCMTLLNQYTVESKEKVKSSWKDFVNYSPPGSSVRVILPARILEWVAIPFSRESSPPRDWTLSPTLQADSLRSELPEKS